MPIALKTNIVKSEDETCGELTISFPIRMSDEEILDMVASDDTLPPSEGYFSEGGNYANRGFITRGERFATYHQSFGMDV